MRNLLISPVILILLVSCRSDPPDVQGVQWYLEISYCTADDSTDAYLHLAVSLSEPQGYSDITDMSITGPGELLWQLQPESISYRQEGSVFFLNIGRLSVLPGMRGFPAGTYKFSVTDIPGNVSEKEFFLPRPSWVYSFPQNFPDLRYDEHGVTVFGKIQVLHRSSSGKLVKREEVIDELALFPRGDAPESYYLLLHEEDSRITYSYGPVFPTEFGVHP